MYQDTNLRLNTLCKMFPFLKKKIFSVKRNKEFSESRVSKELQEGAVGNILTCADDFSTEQPVLRLLVQCTQSLEVVTLLPSQTLCKPGAGAQAFNSSSEETAAGSL